MSELTGDAFYVHDTSRGCLGDSMIWWKHNDCGYVTDIREAKVFTREELREVLQAEDLVAYPVDYIQARVEHHVSIESVKPNRGLRTVTGVGRVDE